MFCSVLTDAPQDDLRCWVSRVSLRKPVALNNDINIHGGSPDVVDRRRRPSGDTPGPGPRR
jgi:hypothetical protein